MSLNGWEYAELEVPAGRSGRRAVLTLPDADPREIAGRSVPALLSELGQSQWELVATTSGVNGDPSATSFYLKRQLSAVPDSVGGIKKWQQHRL